MKDSKNHTTKIFDEVSRPYGLDKYGIAVFSNTNDFLNPNRQEIGRIVVSYTGFGFLWCGMVRASKYDKLSHSRKSHSEFQCFNSPSKYSK